MESESSESDQRETRLAIVCANSEECFAIVISDQWQIIFDTPLYRTTVGRALADKVSGVCVCVCVHTCV